MPKLTAIQSANRIETVLAVWELVISGESLGDSLKQHGMSDSTYRRWLPSALEARDILDRAKQDVELIAYSDILATKNRVLRMLLQDALDSLTEPKDRLAILMYLDTQSDVLRDRNRPSIERPEFLDGPNLIEAESKVLGGGVFDVTIRKDSIQIKSTPPTIIDGEIIDID
jgi:hypothetical protein